jgi:8-oxo-dGTP diphosphatase
MVPGRPASSRPGQRGRQSRQRPKQLLVVAALLERGDRVLLSRRRADQSWPLRWEFPGGKVEPGESAEAALVREIREELGCVIRVGEMVEVLRHSYPEFDLVMPVYRASLARGTPRAVTVAAVAWVPHRRLRLARWRRPALPALARARKGMETLPGSPSTRTRAPRRARDKGAPSSRRTSTPVRRS